MTKTLKETVPFGGYVLKDEPISFNTDKPVTCIKVKNTGDRPVQIGSHYHFFEVNKDLEFDRSQALGKHLNITATTAIRFEPGDDIIVELIPFSGERNILGFNNLVDMSGIKLDKVIQDPVKTECLVTSASNAGFKNKK